MASINDVQLVFRIGTTSRRIALRPLKNDLYVLPGGEEAFIAKAVMKLIGNLEGACILDNQHLKRILACVEESGSDRPMVPVHRITAGPTDKSARYSVQLNQTINSGQPVSALKNAMLTFTLPVSQIESLGDGQLAAPLWLILEKLENKATSKWGKRYRIENAVISEFVPATLRASTSRRVHALTSWLVALQRELMDEFERSQSATDLVQQNNEKIAQEFFEKYQNSTASLPNSELVFRKLKFEIHKHGSGAMILFQKKVLETRGL